MIETPRITSSEAQPMACIHITVAAAEIRTVMGPAINEIYAALAAQGIAPTGPWFTHHFKRPTDIFDFEACVPVASPVAVSGRVKPGELAARKRVARTIYHGGYEGLGAGWGEFMGWIEANGHQGAEDLWECYLVGPESGPDATGYRTELNRPLNDE